MYVMWTNIYIHYSKVAFLYVYFENIFYVLSITELIFGFRQLIIGREKGERIKEKQ